MIPSENLFDSFLKKCASGQPEDEIGAGPRIAGESFPCPACGGRIESAFRLCPYCGDFQGLGYFGVERPPEFTRGGFTVSLRNLVLDWEGLTRTDLRIRNRELERKNLSLVFNESAIIDVEGRQYVSVLSNAADGTERRMLSDWFYVYGEAFVEGSLLFPSLKSAPDRLIISLTEQDGTETCFHFPLSAPLFDERE